MWINNETGLIHPIEAIAEIAQSGGVLLHSDAVQALGQIPINVEAIPVDCLSFSGHKVGTPSGIGCLYLRKGTTLKRQSYRSPALLFAENALRTCSEPEHWPALPK